MHLFSRASLPLSSLCASSLQSQPRLPFSNKSSILPFLPFSSILPLRCSSNSPWMGPDPCVLPTFDSPPEIPSTAESIFNALSPELKEGCQPNPRRVALQTPTRKMILEALLENVTCPSFEPTTNILIGAKGIGKTRVLRQLQSIGNQLDANLGIAYTDLRQHASTISSVLPSRLLEKIVIDRLGSTVEHRKSDPNPVLPALASLKRLGKRVVLFYDETESLYMKNSPERVRFLRAMTTVMSSSVEVLRFCRVSSQTASPVP